MVKFKTGIKILVTGFLILIVLDVLMPKVGLQVKEEIRTGMVYTYTYLLILGCSVLAYQAMIVALFYNDETEKKIIGKTKTWIVIVLLSISVFIGYKYWEFQKSFEAPPDLTLQIQNLQNDITLLTNKISKMNESYALLEANKSVLNQTISEKEATLEETQKNHTLLQTEFEEYKTNHSLDMQPPYVTVEGSNIISHYKTVQGELRNLSFSLNSYHNAVNKSKPTISINQGVPDYSSYVDSNMFLNMITKMTQGKNEKEFSRDVYNYINQFKIKRQSYSINLKPRYPIETIVDGEGNVEDLAILAASLLYAGDAQANYNNTGISFVFFPEINMWNTRTEKRLLIRTIYGEGRLGFDYFDPAMFPEEKWPETIPGALYVSAKGFS